MKQQLLKNLGVVACTLAMAASVRAAALPNVVVLATDPTALEGTSAGSFTLIRSGDTNSSLTVNLGISGTASNGVDYAAIPNTVTLPAGALAVDIPVTPLIDLVNRGNKTVVLSLQSNAGYNLTTASRATVKIVDDVFDIPPPTVSITSPADGSVFTSPASITLQAAASDPQLPIQSVSFFANDNFVGRVTTSPYSLVVNHVPPGNYSVFARAVDQFGKSAVSQPVDIIVSAEPVVTLLTPNGTNYNVGDLVQLVAQIGDTKETIRSVTFTASGKILGTVTNAPFTFNWQTTTQGTFNVQASAVDKNTGRKGSSAVVPITVVYGGGA
jgi:hypothetical protein